MVGAESQKALAALYLIPEGEYVEVDLANAVSTFSGLSRKWCKRLLNYVERSNVLEGGLSAPQFTGRYSMKLRTIIVDHRRLAEKWPTFDWVTALLGRNVA